MTFRFGHTADKLTFKIKALDFRLHTPSLEMISYDVGYVCNFRAPTSCLFNTNTYGFGGSLELLGFGFNFWYHSKFSRGLK